MTRVPSPLVPLLGAAILATSLALLLPAGTVAQTAALDRLPVQVLDVTPPSSWVLGIPGGMTVRPAECREMPTAGLRRRIVDVAVQEWAFFGFPVMDRQNQVRLLPLPADPTGNAVEVLQGLRGAPALGPRESARVAATIAGYWAVTPEGPAIVVDQNRSWNGSAGIAARWNSPWSAAFISWVMCEAGLGTRDEFRRAIAHWTYIDQAIRARDGAAPGAAFVAHDIGEVEVEPGDLLCSGSRPAYRSLAERRRQMGAGARSHCDIVVEVDEVGERVLVIGGNVLRSVALKVLPASRQPSGILRPGLGSTGTLYAHLKLMDGPVEADALRSSPTFALLACTESDPPPARIGFVLSQIAGGSGPLGYC